MTIIWCMVTEIWSMTDRIFCNFGPFFGPFNSLKTRKIKILENWKKFLEILSFCTNVPKIMIICYTVPENCIFILHCSGCNYYFSFCAIFCEFIGLTAQKIKISKKWKKTWRYHHFRQVYQKPKIMIIWYTVPEIWRVTDVIFIFHFGLFFALLPY